MNVEQPFKIFPLALLHFEQFCYRPTFESFHLGIFLELFSHNHQLIVLEKI